MMKSFFKKLAFVMALAMVVSLAAPAAKTAVAAEEKKPLAIAYQDGAAITALNLKKVGDEEDLRFLYAPANYKELGVNWSSSNPNVVSVDDNGIVKAEAAGTATISVAVGTETASIEVYSVDMKTFEATIGTKEERKITEKTIEIGDSFDFAFFGVQDYDMNRYNCQWLLVDPAGVAELDRATGEVKAKAAGTCVLTLVVINKVTLTEIKVADCVITIPAEEVEVVAQPAIKAVQKTQNKFEIEFTDLVAAAYTDADIEVVRIAPADKDMDGNGVIDQLDVLEEAFFIRPTSADKDNNKFVVDTYADFVDGATYVVRVGEYKDQFVASVGAVARIEMSATEGIIASDGVAATAAKLSVKLFDENGIDVTTVVIDGIINKDRVIYGMEWSDIAYQYDNEITFIEEGTVTATAYYECYNITETTKVEAKIPVKGVKHADYIAKVIAWKAVKAGGEIDWNAVVKNNEPLWVASEDDGYYIVALLEDSRGNYFSTHVEGTKKKFNDKVVYAMDFVDEAIGSSYVFAANGYTLEFATLNPDNLLMYKDGQVVTYKETTSYIKLNLYNVYSDAAPQEIATVPLLVKPARTIRYVEGPASLYAVTDTINDALFGDLTKTKATIKVFDQYKDAWTQYANYELTLVPSNYTETEKADLEAYAADLTATLPNADSDGKFEITFDAQTIRGFLKDSIAANKSNRNSVSFKLTEKTSGRFVTIKINLQVPNYENRDEIAGVIDIDDVRTNNLSVVDSCTNGTTVEESAYFKDGKFVTADRKANIELYRTSKSYKVGYELDELVIYNGYMNVNKYATSTAADIKKDAMMLVVTGPDGKAVPVAATAGALGIQVIDKGGYYTYELVVADSSNGEMAYAPTGRYTVQVRTVLADPDKDGNFKFVTASDTKKTTNVKYVTVTRNNDKITFASQTTRDLRESADTIEEVVANAFTFKRGNDAWYTGDKLQALVYSVNAERGDDYVYIKSVKFMVPVDKTENIGNGYYLYEVPVGRSVKVSTDLFY